MDISETTDVAWCFKSLKDIAIGLRNLHNVGISHQDLKPSNILVFNTESKISDLGRSMCENLNGPYNDWIFSGDQTYAPWEVFYGYMWTEDWHLKNYNTWNHGIKAIKTYRNNIITTDEPKILLLTESYSDVISPFLACAYANIDEIDLRIFTGSLQAYIEQTEPDIVISMYSAYDFLNSTSWNFS